MKKALLSVVGVAVAMALSSVALAEDTNAAYSANAVGVIKYSIPANGGLTCIALPLNPMDSSDAEQRWVWGETPIAQQLDNGSDVYFWNGTGWDTFTKDIEDGTWNRVARNYSLQPGEAIFVRSPKGSAAKTVSLLGELPVDDNITYSLTGSGNLDVRGITPYPVAGTFGTTSISSNLPAGSDVYFWNGTGWDTFTKDIEDGTWNRVARNYSYFVGEGIFVRPRGNVTSVTNDIPFVWTK